jgi:hypothetical protein
VVCAGEKPSVQREPGRGRRHDRGSPVRLAFADTDAMGVAWILSPREVREFGPLSQDETVFMRRFGDVIHDSKDKIFG